MVFIIITLLTAVGAAIHLAADRRSGLSRGRVVEVCLLYLLAGSWGFGAALLALPHILAPDYVAEYIGWQAGNPFQVELGFANLGRALLGILSIRFRGTFWVAPVVTNSVFSLGAAYVHLQDIFEHSNYSPGNAGPVLFLDIIVPVVAIALLVAYLRERNGESSFLTNLNR
jgi:hypothetical protein